ncbi:MAG: class I SAM-dependent methyltransferase [Rhodobacteraceae bacterium]|nr:class I SAM-dependent methyltransferase [Paracoccaceae bacterium]
MNATGTLTVYDRMVEDYAAMAAGWETPGLTQFLALLPPASRVLDLGCGPGFDAARIAEAGHDVLAVDGAAGMVARAAQHGDITVRQATFDDIPDLGQFEGVWASFSLLHAPKAVFPRHLRALHVACRPGSPLGLGMKTGSGEGEDHLGRFYSYYSEADLRDHLSQAGFTPTDAITGAGKGLAGTTDSWIVMFAHA